MECISNKMLVIMYKHNFIFWPFLHVIYSYLWALYTIFYRKMVSSNFSIFLGFWICLIFNETCTCAWFLFGISQCEWFLVAENTSCCMHIWELNLCRLRQFKPLKLLSVLLLFKGLIFWTVFITNSSVLYHLFVMLSLFVDFDIENYTWLIKYCCFPDKNITWMISLLQWYTLTYLRFVINSINLSHKTYERYCDD